MGNEVSQKYNEQFFNETKELDRKLRNQMRKVFLNELTKLINLKNEVYEKIKLHEIARLVTSQVKIEGVTISVFDGANYNAWKKR